MSTAPLSEEQQQRVKERLASHLPDLTCPTCGSEDWNLEEQLHLVPGLDLSGTVDFSAGVAAVLLTCEACSQVRFFNAEQMGIVNRE